MNISIITPAYNEAKNIERYFRSIQKIDYPKANFELLFIDSNSSDNSVKVLEDLQKNSDIDIKIIPLKKNLGKSMTRLLGAQKATHDNLLFLDCKCEIFPDVLKNISNANYQPIKGVVVQKQDHIFDRFFYLIRFRKYRGKIGETNVDHFINKENFDKYGKGTTMFFCNRQLFMDSQMENVTEKDNSDDTKIFWNIVQKKAIFVTPEIKVYYNTRKKFLENISHTYSKGPRFIDYYYKPQKNEFWILNLSILISITTLYLIIQGKYILPLSLSLLATNTIVALYLAQNIKDFFISFILFPPITIAFLIGVVKGLTKKAIKPLLPKADQMNA